MNDPTALTLREAAAAIAQGRLRAEALVEACLDRIARLQPMLNCFIRVTADDAREQARAADRAVKAGHALGPLHGVPLAHKDMFYRAGEVCTCGSKIRADFVPDHTATVLTRLDAAGAIETRPPQHGGIRHWAQPATTSISGAAEIPGIPITSPAALRLDRARRVAAGLAFGALGSDTGGSVRLPAAACGVVGIKPTLGRVSRYGTMPLSHSLDCIGVLARSVGDCARLLSVIAGADARDGMSSRRPVPDYERGLDEAAQTALACRRDGRRAEPTIITTDGSEETLSCSRQAARCSRSAARKSSTCRSATTAPSTISSQRDPVARGRRRCICHGCASVRRITPSRPARACWWVLGVPVTPLLQAMQARARLLEELLRDTFAQCDVLHVPVLKRPVPTAAETDVGGSATMAQVLGRDRRQHPAVQFSSACRDWSVPIGLAAQRSAAGDAAGRPAVPRGFAVSRRRRLRGGGRGGSRGRSFSAPVAHDLSEH